MNEYKAKLCCQKKKAFASAVTASDAAWHVRKNTGNPVSAYRCSVCGQFHVGTEQPGDRGRIRSTRTVNNRKRGRLSRLRLKVKRETAFSTGDE